MKLKFEIEYRTNWGEEMFIELKSSEENLADRDAPIAMHTCDGVHWCVEVEYDEYAIEYRYLLASRESEPSVLRPYSVLDTSDIKVVREEWSEVKRKVHLRDGEGERTCSFADVWRDVPENRVFFTAPFIGHYTQASWQFSAPVIRACNRSVILQVLVANLPDMYSVSVLGNCTALGEWQGERALPLTSTDRVVWQTELDAAYLTDEIEYKFVLIDRRTNRLALWEDGENRRLNVCAMSYDETLVVDCRQAHFNLPQWKAAGVAVPVFSLRSEDSWGIGDFADLKMFIEWAARTGQHIVQILPVNDTTLTHTWRDSYPYNAISVFALHPLYLAPRLMICGDIAKDAAVYEEPSAQLNALAQVDYERVAKLKWGFFEWLYEIEGTTAENTEPYKLFVEENKAWLCDYADFCAQRDGRVASLYVWLQYHLHTQLLDVATYARSQGVSLKGDLPIGVNPDGVDVRSNPKLFNINTQTGAPPDDFAVHGQNWRFPTYNWDAMKQDGYQWWRKRFEAMSKYFDAYRIDHILGFFRIWEIPSHAVRGLLGQFSPALPLSVVDIERAGVAKEHIYVEPYITEDKGLEKYLKRSHNGRYALRKHYDTQRKIVDKGAPHELLDLTEEVLFVRDHRQPDRYHPRINAQSTAVYKSLPSEQQQAFDRLHHDFYYNRHNDFWLKSAQTKLPSLVYATSLLPCGEDLGMIPASVPRVMQDLHVLSLEIQRMPKGWEEFGNPQSYPYNSVSSLSTHDMSTLRGWWEEDYERACRYYQQMLHRHDTAPRTLDPLSCEAIVRAELSGRSMLCVLSLQDWLSIHPLGHQRPAQEERINVPSDPNNYWCYRMHTTIEDLLKASTLNQRIRELLQISGRLDVK